MSAIFDSEHSRVVHDGFPVSTEHVLVVPKRHVQYLGDLSEAEYIDLWSLVRRVRGMFKADMNIGVNDGPIAGQTVPHAHVHLIGRHEGDVPDPRGGVRWVIPQRADYWSGR
jgi:diadenosine tetraphosphate (Ap4A) HIT family hydrolase